ncbi:MAG: signal recognition particle protein [Propionibacteriaceae bacterium]|jgi:signal recognition particle subunit SRP54|nr:signal recognition particle protein [Propionibacteriaceae bacterium]
MFDTLSERLSATFKNLRGKGRITDEDIDAAAREIRIALLEADVNLGVVKAFVARLKQRAHGMERSAALNPTQQIVKIVDEELAVILGGETRHIAFAKEPPTVIMLAGLQGAGKTTLAGKLGKWLHEQGHSPLLVAADLQRPNAVNQLSVVAERAGVQVYAPEPGNGVGDPVKVAQDSLIVARRQLFDVVIIDTAGRLGVDAELMTQASNIKAATQADETLFVVDAMIGQDAVNTALAFEQGVGVDGVVLTKLDGDARGGAALSIRQVIGKPIMFASTGEGLDDFDVFHPDRMASRILGMGDMLTLIEQAEKSFDAEQSRIAAEKLLRGKNEYSLQDFLGQMQQMRKMGSMTKIMGMLPGMSQYKEAIENYDEREVDRIEAIIYSMTPAERADVGILNGSRRMRIARGSGTTVQAVNEIVNRFVGARKMMQQMSPMMGGLAAASARSAGKQSQKKKGKKVSGNPAKRAAIEAGREAKGREAVVAAIEEEVASLAPDSAFTPGSAFGFDIDAVASELETKGAGDFKLPPSLAQMFNEQTKGPR